mgnify:CR=1 FL=1
MKRRFLIILCIFFMGVAASPALDQSHSDPAKTAAVKSLPKKATTPKTPPETRMRATGKVIAITSSSLTIERNVKGAVETMDFILTKPQDKILAGDEVGVSYITKDNRNIAKRITKVAKKKLLPTKSASSPAPSPAAK